MSTEVHYPWFKKADIDGFFALFQNNLANFVLIAIIMLGQGFPANIVYGRVIPGAAIAVLIGNFYYAYMAGKLAKKTGRTDITALAYGISTPVMFIYLFGVLGPALALTGDPEMAWRIGVAGCFLGGFIEALGSIIGGWVRRNVPRAAMLGALAGVAFTFIGGELLFRVYEMPVVGIIVLAIILIGLISRKPMPFRIPTALFAIVIGTVLAYVLGQADPARITGAMQNVGFFPPLPSFGFVEGFGYLFGPLIGLLASIVPIAIYNFVETMNNVEAMACCGDDYNVQEAQLVDGIGTMLGSVFGGVFPTTVYIASVGSKWMGAGRGYSILNGIVFILASTFGIIGVLGGIIPVPVIAPILVYVGISMVSQTFSSTKESHYPAAVLAMFPYFANYIMTRFNVDAPEAVLARTGSGTVPLGQGAMFTALLWGAILAFIIDEDYIKATVTSLIAAALAFIGLIHAPRLSLDITSPFGIGYLVMAILFIVFSWMYKNEKVAEKLHTDKPEDEPMKPY